MDSDGHFCQLSNWGLSCHVAIASFDISSVLPSQTFKSTCANHENSRSGVRLNRYDLISLSECIWTFVPTTTGRHWPTANRLIPIDSFLFSGPCLKWGCNRGHFCATVSGTLCNHGRTDPCSNLKSLRNQLTHLHRHYLSPDIFALCLIGSTVTPCASVP